MEVHPEVAACQPKLLSQRNKEFFEYAGAAGGYIDRYGYPFCRGRIFETVEKDGGQYDTVMPVFWVSGAAFFVRLIIVRQEVWMGVSLLTWRKLIFAGVFAAVEEDWYVFRKVWCIM